MVTTGAQKRESYSGDYKALGKSGEAIVLEWLRRRSGVASVVDLRQDVAYQEADVDFEIVWEHSGRRELVEVKTDASLGVSGNMVFELLRINHRTDALGRRGEVGWSLRTPAHWLFWWAPAISSIIYGRPPAIQSWFQEWSGQQRDNMRTKWVSTDEHKSTLIALVRWEMCSHLFTVAKISDDFLRIA